MNDFDIQMRLFVVKFNLVFNAIEEIERKLDILESRLIKLDGYRKIREPDDEQHERRLRRARKDGVNGNMSVRGRLSKTRDGIL